MVKLGSAVVTRSSGSGIALGRTANVIEQLCHLQASGREVILVSSGAVAAGRHLLHSGRRLIEDLPIPSRPMPPVHCQVEADVQLRAGRWEVATAQECASVGQSSLMALYDAMFKLYGIQSGQVLITTAGLLDREPRTSTCKTVNRLVSRGILPVINENDALLPLPHEGDGSIGIPVTDNDAIASILAKELKCEALLLLSNVDGVFTGDPDDPSAKLLSEITPSTAKDIQFRGSSSAGRGGMASKVTSAVYAAEAGVNVIIGNGLKFRSILDIIDGKDVGTIVWRP
eukprot:CAMPEP_0184480556 /NCGR_PEP_ID=MMETSP0113_2-20130426/2051_1 /TAXON_ID=91329 /ORGANISM="Norrisiella sphaerica, Strain BC52" /LENGTH=285 /DNA_ID=CAMNT_0026859101 /DNA_START=335 /DNA_END=1192 /DNA_ORIENTATION=+